MFKYIFLCTVGITGLIACGPKSNPQETNTVLTAYRLIDEQRTDEAISLLESELSVNPKNDEYKTILASAYAHKAGIKIQKLAPMVNQSEKIKGLNRRISVSSSEESTNERVSKLAANMGGLFTSLAGFFEVYASIPLVNTEQVSYLNQSIAILESLEQPKQENALYRGILRIVLLKYRLADGFIGEFIPPAIEAKDLGSDSDTNSNKQSCRIDFVEVATNAANVAKILIDVCNDIALANPQHANQMRQASQQLTDVLSNIMTSTSTVTALDEVASLFLKETAIQNGLGKIIKCGGS